MTFVDQIWSMFPHNHCVRIPWLEVTLQIEFTLIGLLYYWFAFVKYQRYKLVKSHSLYYHSANEHLALFWVFVFCGAAKFIHALNLVNGPVYFLNLPNNTLEIPFMIYLAWQNWIGKNLDHKQISDVPVKKVEEVLDGKILKFEDTLTRSEEAIKAIQKNLQAIRLLEKFAIEAPTPLAFVDTKMNYIAVSKEWDRLFKVKTIPGENHYDKFPIIKDPESDYYKWQDDHKQVIQFGKTLSGNDDFGDTKIYWHIKPLVLEGEVQGMIMHIFDHKIIN